VVALARRRELARRAREFGLADQLRLEVEGAGWTLTDTAEGFSLAPKGPEIFASYLAAPSRQTEPDACLHSVCVAYHGWPEDLERLLGALLPGAPAGALEVVLAIADAGQAPAPALLHFRGEALARPPVVVTVGASLGQAEALNLAARRALGRLVHFVEPSLEFGYAVLETASMVLEDPAVGACGPLGLDTLDWRDFHAAPGPEVMALEYLVSIRRADLERIGEMDAGYRFYRNLDLDFSRQVAATGMSLRTYPATVTRHRHRLWEATPVAERERLSRRNFNRLLDRWGRRGGGGS
jgi:hypothetical protein